MICCIGHCHTDRGSKGVCVCASEGGSECLSAACQMSESSTCCVSPHDIKKRLLSSCHTQTHMHTSCGVLSITALFLLLNNLKHKLSKRMRAIQIKVRVQHKSTKIHHEKVKKNKTQTKQHQIASKRVMCKRYIL